MSAIVNLDLCIVIFMIFSEIASGRIEDLLRCLALSIKELRDQLTGSESG